MDSLFSLARKTKDQNFDGKFLFGVKTTGIFCRPSCPSPVAKEANVLYFETIFEALKQGFRPCLRCRPDIAVEYHTHSATGTSVVDAALKLIYDGYLLYNTLGDLATELGLSGRHLRQHFVNNLGVPPIKVARFHKALFAKKLLTSSANSVADIAFASGFGSIRQFNETFRTIFGMTPTQARKQATEGGKHLPGSTLQLRYPNSFDFRQVLSFMRPRAIRGVEVVDQNSYSRTFRTKNAHGYFTVTDDPRNQTLHLAITCDDVRCFMELYGRVRRMFDLDTDFSVINARFAKDPLLARGMKGGHVPRLPVAFAPFEFMVRAILGQQISVKAATTLAARVAREIGLPTPEGFPPGLELFFPTAREIVDADLDGLGITATRQRTVHTATRAVLEEAVRLTPNQPFDTFRKAFLALPGIGEWTVNYVAMRGLGMVDSFPAGDLGVIRALTTGEAAPTGKHILRTAEAWRPYRAYAALCLWNSDAQGVG